MRLKTTFSATIAAASLAIAAAASPAAADAGRYNHCGKSTVRHYQCAYLADGSIATCPGGSYILPIETLLVTDGNGDGFACAKDDGSLQASEDAIVR